MAPHPQAFSPPSAQRRSPFTTARRTLLKCASREARGLNPPGSRGSPRSTEPLGSLCSLGGDFLGRTPGCGYSLVEALVTLSILSFIAVTAVNFVQDIETRQKLAQAQADLAAISDAVQLAEQDLTRGGVATTSTVPLLNLKPPSVLAGLLERRLLTLPDSDPWGHQYYEVHEGNNTRFALVTPSTPASVLQSSPPTPYIIDEGLGRVISPGPDGVCNTRIGQDPPDRDNDLIVDFRKKPFVFFNVGEKIYVNSADGSTHGPADPAGIKLTEGKNARVSPDGTRFFWITNNTLKVGDLAWIQETQTAQPEPRLNTRTIAPSGETPLLSSSGVVLQDANNLSISESTFPVWTPDGRGIIFISGKDLYRYDLNRQVTVSGERVSGAVIELTRGDFLNVEDSASAQGRYIINNSWQTVYQSSSSEVHLAVSEDGKIAFFRKETSVDDAFRSGLYLVLGDGTGLRALRVQQSQSSRPPGIPVGWVDSNTVLYREDAGGEKGLKRIGQDGTLDIPLFNPTTGNVVDILAPSISMDRRFVAFFGSGSLGYVSRTDGIGLLEGTFEGTGINTELPARWLSRKASSGNHVFFVSSQDGARKLGQVEIDTKNGEKLGGFTSLDGDRGDVFSGAKVLAYDLSEDETLLAVMAEGVGGGLRVLPLTGARTEGTLLPNTTPSPAVPSYVRWLDR